MTGKWVGFGKEFDVNTGPWELVFQDPSTNKATLAAYNKRPDA
ncbi:DNA-binding protein [Streptomyces sp. NBC_00885]